MAERRMLKRRITSSDAFVGLSSAAQALYMHLNLDADDDGFNDQVQTAMSRAHASTDDLNILLVRGFIYRFENGVIVIKHWRLHNLLRKDRYKPTDHLEEIDRLGVKENGEYVVRDALGCQTVATWLPQDSLVEDNIVLSKESARTRAHARTHEESAEGTHAPGARSGTFTFKIPTVDEVKAYSDENGLDIDAERFVDYYSSKGWTVGKSKMEDWRAAARNWARRERGARSQDGERSSFDVSSFFDAAIKKTYEGGDKE